MKELKLTKNKMAVFVEVDKKVRCIIISKSDIEDITELLSRKYGNIKVSDVHFPTVELLTME